MMAPTAADGEPSRYPYDMREGGKYFDLVMMIVSQVRAVRAFVGRGGSATAGRLGVHHTSG